MLVQLAFPTHYVCGTGTRTSSSGSGHQKLLVLRPHSPGTTVGFTVLKGALNRRGLTVVFNSWRVYFGNQDASF